MVNDSSCAYQATWGRMTQNPCFFPQIFAPPYLTGLHLLSNPPNAERLFWAIWAWGNKWRVKKKKKPPTHGEEIQKQIFHAVLSEWWGAGGEVWWQKCPTWPGQPDVPRLRSPAARGALAWSPSLEGRPARSQGHGERLRGRSASGTSQLGPEVTRDPRL